MRGILKFFGLVTDEYHHIVAQFHEAVTALENLSERKRQEIVTHAAAELDHAKAKAAAVDAVRQADNTAAKLRELVS